MRPDDEAPTVAAFSDRVAEAVERKRSQLVVGLDPRVDLLPVELRGEAVVGRAAAASSGRALLQGDHRRRRSLRRCRQAAGRVLRGARQRRLGGPGGGVAVRSGGRPARHRRRQAGRYRFDRACVRRCVPRAARLRSATRRCPLPSTRTSAPIRWIRSSPPAATTAPACSCSCGRPTLAGAICRRPSSRTARPCGGMSPAS